MSSDDRRSVQWLGDNEDDVWGWLRHGSPGRRLRVGSGGEIEIGDARDGGWSYVRCPVLWWIVRDPDGSLRATEGDDWWHAYECDGSRGSPCAGRAMISVRTRSDSPPERPVACPACGAEARYRATRSADPDGYDPAQRRP